jgi:hypothetical protein
VNIRSVRKELDRALDCRNADAIKSHHQALHLGVKRIEEAVTQETQARGWGLNMIKDIMQKVDNSTWEWLRDADRVLQELAREERAAHHAARVEDLAESSEVLGRTRWWSRQDCIDFCKELDCKLQAYDKANNELELFKMPTGMRQAAHLQTEEVDTAAYHARQIIDRVLWDHDYRWREFQ